MNNVGIVLYGLSLYNNSLWVYNSIIINHSSFIIHQILVDFMCQTAITVGGFFILYKQKNEKSICSDDVASSSCIGRMYTQDHQIA